MGCYEVEGGEGWELSEAGKALNERTTGQLLHKMRRWSFIHIIVLAYVHTDCDIAIFL